MDERRAAIMEKMRRGRMTVQERIESGRANAKTVLGAPPEKLYKYLKMTYADSLIGSGSTRVGTLYDFRDEERHGAGIGDAAEGKKSVLAVIDGVFDGGTKKADALKEMGINMGAGCTDISFVNSFAMKDINHQDALVWCCSTECSLDAMKQLEGADTCVEIETVPFFEALSDAVRNQYGDVMHCGPFCVSYQNRDEVWNGADLGVSPVFVKDGEQFSAQKEVRMAWFNPNQIDYVFKAGVLKESECWKFCKIIDMKADPD